MKNAHEIYRNSNWFSDPLSAKEKKVIAQDISMGIQYARDVINGRWDEVEKHMLKPSTLKGSEPDASNQYAYLENNNRFWNNDFRYIIDYCDEFIKGRWKELEEVLLKNEFAFIAAKYATDVLESRWKDAEGMISKSPVCALIYARDTLKQRFEEAEEVIKQSPTAAAKYAVDVLGTRWPEAEPAILQSPRTAMEYCQKLIKGRWPELEEVIVENSNLCMDYIEATKTRWPAFEKKMLKLKSPHKILRYLNAVGAVGQELHNKMIMLSFDSKHKRKVEQYFYIIEERKKKHRNFLKRVKNWLIAHRDKKVNDVLEFIEKDEYNPIVE